MLSQFCQFLFCSLRRKSLGKQFSFLTWVVLARLTQLGLYDDVIYTLRSVHFSHVWRSSITRFSDFTQEAAVAQMSSSSQPAKPSLLILGARGFLGRSVATAAAARFNVLRADRTAGERSTDIVVDITDANVVEQTIREIQPKAVVLLAAISDIDLCERQPERAAAVNVQGVAHVARACAATGTRLLFTSSGAVFDGKKIGYCEEDPVSPLSVYGRSKADAENVVLETLPDAIVLRVSLVLGRTGLTTTNSVVDTLVRRWQAGEIVRASTLECRNPIDAATLATWIIELLPNPEARGLIHTGSTHAWTRYQIATALATRLGVPEVQLLPEETTSPARALRGVHQLLLTDKIARLCTTQPPTIEEVVERSLREPAESHQ